MYHLKISQTRVFQLIFRLKPVYVEIETVAFQMCLDSNFFPIPIEKTRAMRQHLPRKRTMDVVSKYCQRSKQLRWRLFTIYDNLQFLFPIFNSTFKIGSSNKRILRSRCARNLLAVRWSHFISYICSCNEIAILWTELLPTWTYFDENIKWSHLACGAVPLIRQNNAKFTAK